MKRLGSTALTAFVAVASLTADDHKQRVIQYLDHEIELNRPGMTSSHQYYILASDSEIVAQLKELVRDPESAEYWSAAFTALGMIGSVDSRNVRVEELFELVQSLERQRDEVEVAVWLRALGTGYGAIGRCGGQAALDFLAARLSADFWGHSVPRHSSQVGCGSSVVLTDTAQTEAMRGLSYHPSGDAAQLLRRLQSDAAFSSDPVLALAAQTHLGIHPSEQKLRVERLAAWQEKANRGRDLFITP